MDRVKRLLARLTEANPALSARDAAEVLWLASHMDGFQQALGQAPPLGDSGRSDLRERESGGEPAAGGRAADRGAPDEDSTVWYPPPGGTEAPPVGLDALPLHLPDTRELRHPLDLQRGLRPLLRMVNTGTDLVLDEETTVRYSADARAVVPALVRSPERWLDLALIIDTGQSMILWDKLIAEFRRMLTRLGAFRTVRTWYLRSDGKAVAISSGSPAGSQRAVKELVDPAGRQAMLVVTDCVGEPWHTGEAMEALDVWARTGPLAIVQPLSQRLWSRSAVACHNVQLLAPYPGAPNHRLIVDPGSRPRTSRLEENSAADGRSGDDAAADGAPGARFRAGAAVPILEMTPRWLASWARLISGTSPVSAIAAFTGAPPEATGDGADLSQRHNPVQVVERFIGSASPEAVRLAGLLAAAPLYLPLMRRIQNEMLPDSRLLRSDSRPLPLAEVYLGGLLRSLSARGANGEERHDTFDFLDGIRDVLLGTIKKSEALEVMDLVSDQLSRSYGKGEGSHTAWVEVPSGTAGGRHMTTADAFYGTIKASVLCRMGIADSRVDANHVVHEDPEPALVLASATVADLIPEPLPEAELVAVGVPGGPDSSVTSEQLEHGITLIGTPSSGKTTLLGALGPALTQRHAPTDRPAASRRGDEWLLVPTDDGSAQTLISMITHLTADQIFPEATSVQIMTHGWQLRGHNPRARWQWFRRPRQVRVDLHVTDPSGEILLRKTGREEDLIEALVDSRGLIFMFDPIREFEYGDGFEYVLNVVTRLTQRIIGSDTSADGKLPHYISVCISKFDDPRVFEAARMLRLLTVLPDDQDQYQFPRVSDDDAREFFTQLCAVSKTGTARMAMDTIERVFRAERIRYFVTSAIGFYVDRRTGVFSFDDYVNTLPGTPVKIRGAIHPINVAEPFIWLGGRLAAESPERSDSR